MCLVSALHTSKEHLVECLQLPQCSNPRKAPCLFLELHGLFQPTQTLQGSDFWTLSPQGIHSDLENKSSSPHRALSGWPQNLRICLRPPELPWGGHCHSWCASSSRAASSSGFALEETSRLELAWNAPKLCGRPVATWCTSMHSFRSMLWKWQKFTFFVALSRTSADQRPDFHLRWLSTYKVLAFLCLQTETTYTSKYGHLRAQTETNEKI